MVFTVGEKDRLILFSFQLRRQRLDLRVADAFAVRKGRSGAPGLTRDLRDQGRELQSGHRGRYMRRQGLRAKAARKFKATTNSNHTPLVEPNLPLQNFTAQAPNQKWVRGITYLWTTEGCLYLAVVIDLYSRKGVGWAISERITSELTCNALLMALWRRHMAKEVIVHSDRGSRYYSARYQSLLSQHDLICSMSAKGNC